MYATPYSSLAVYFPLSFFFPFCYLPIHCYSFLPFPIRLLIKFYYLGIALLEGFMCFSNITGIFAEKRRDRFFASFMRPMLMEFVIVYFLISGINDGNS